MATKTLDEPIALVNAYFRGKPVLATRLIRTCLMLVMLTMLVLLRVEGASATNSQQPAGSKQPTNGNSSSLATNLAVWLGPAETVLGPDQRTDNPFHTLGTTPNIMAYVANGDTYGFTTNNLETLQQLAAPVLVRGASGTFDSCGAWLNSTWQDGTTVRGWYHAETDCNYPSTRKSVAYAESFDEGITFTKPGYPSNQVITAPPRFTDPIQASEGDQHVIKVGNYLYMYFIAGRDYQVRLARSLASDGGKPGTWHKYYNGSFSQPGLGGESTPIAQDMLARSWVSYNSALSAFVGFSYYQDGFGLAISSDGVTSWTRLPNALVVRSQGEYWNRGPDSKELIEYPSLIGLDGDVQNTGTSFWLYYMQLKPGQDFSDGRYLVRRAVHIASTTTDTHSVTPRIAFSRYQSSTLPDTWITTANPGAGYQFVETLGYLFVVQPDANALPVYDCYLSQERDHMLDINSDCSAPGNPNVHNLRQMGWISTVAFDGARRVYRCFDPATFNHFVSADPACEGKRTEWPIGYLAPFTFADSLPGSTYFQYTSCLAYREVEEGFPCGGPNEPCTPGNDPYFRVNTLISRDQVAKFVSSSAGFNENPGPQKFEDVPTSSPFYDWINRLANRSLIGGYLCGLIPGEPCVPPNNRSYYRPSNQATRGQIAKIVSNGAGFSETPAGQTFEDVPPDNPFYIWIERLASRGIMSGYPCGGAREPCRAGNRPYFRWGNNATRGQVAKIDSNTFFPGCSLAIRP